MDVVGEGKVEPFWITLETYSQEANPQALGKVSFDWG